LKKEQDAKTQKQNEERDLRRARLAALFEGDSSD
jgi:hypothetical protein